MDRKHSSCEMSLHGGTRSGVNRNSLLIGRRWDETVTTGQRSFPRVLLGSSRGFFPANDRERGAPRGEQPRQPRLEPEWPPRPPARSELTEQIRPASPLRG